MNDETMPNAAIQGRCRVIIEHVSPEIDGGRYAIKRVPGETVVVEADIFADGHDALAAVLKYRPGAKVPWLETAMEPVGNDRWRGTFAVAEPGEYQYTVEAWVDRFKSWREDLKKRVRAGQDVSMELPAGAELIHAAAARAEGDDARTLRAWAEEIRVGDQAGLTGRTQRALDDSMAGLMKKYSDRRLAIRYSPELRVTVDPVLARFGAWYEMFPRSCPGKAGAHGTFKDVEAHLPRLAEMGFDVLYFPPIHPIGKPFRKGRNNNPVCQPDEPGSPWGIGSAEGGHKTIHPQLGTLEDFRRLVTKARGIKIEVALDIAFQCSPNHPYTREHPEWFRKRPDGSIQYAENPPKKYQDIFPLDFECDDWRGLWRELKSVVDFWIEQDAAFQVHDLLTGERYLWQRTRCYVQLNPAFAPAAIFRLHRRIRTERDFDYFL